MIKRLVTTAVGVALTMAAVVTTVVAAAFALYALLEGPLGRPGAAAAVAALAAVTAGIGAMICLGRAKPTPAEEQSPLGRALDLAREKPILAGAAAIAAGLIAWKNPKIVAALMSAFVAGRTAGKS